MYRLRDVQQAEHCIQLTRNGIQISEQAVQAAELKDGKGYSKFQKMKGQLYRQNPFNVQPAE